MAPAEFVDPARIDAARRLLGDTAMPLQQIASVCGFGNVDGMRRAFTRNLGVSPVDYRRRFCSAWTGPNNKPRLPGRDFAEHHHASR